jgi:hypothetical protein
MLLGADFRILARAVEPEYGGVKINKNVGSSLT